MPPHQTLLTFLAQQLTILISKQLLKMGAQIRLTHFSNGGTMQTMLLQLFSAPHIPILQSCYEKTKLYVNQVSETVLNDLILTSFPTLTILTP